MFDRNRKKALSDALFGFMKFPLNRHKPFGQIQLLLFLAVFGMIFTPLAFVKLRKTAAFVGADPSQSSAFQPAQVLNGGDDYAAEVEKSGFLRQIAKDSGLSEAAKISVCNLKRECRHLQGDRLPESVASLTKVPIAVVLMHKVTTENISLDTPIYLDPANYTEDASDLAVGEQYPLWKILAEMLVHSSNIAPNQLIDYLGWDYINEVLAQRGYRFTRVESKFAGEYIFPADIGFGANTSTADELTEMMVQIYNREHPGDDILISLLKHQHDREMGFAGLVNSSAHWLGEKTGQTSLVLGTTVAMEIAGAKYIVTIIDDGEYSELAIRDAIQAIANYIIKNGDF
uniref:Serine hydrolase n=1 Tax=Planktothricoides sp. SpSt-374 TaxID=2282167 RepID=A0A7C3VKG9_9CYAN